ncbi:MAG TPA: hypothetical protein VKP61_00625 [Candidatus Acidoferrum sp.]|nr:hypothetical protein [Candidatus Acidoferrum sp.]
MRNRMRLGQSINTYDPALALKGETGTFHLTTPGGEELLIECTPESGFGNVYWANQQNKRPFLITKVSEPAHVEGATPITEAA